MIWVNTGAEDTRLPEFSLVGKVGSRTFMVEHCVPYMAAGDTSAALIPDGFNVGAFRITRSLQLGYRSKAPQPSFDAAQAGIERAYNRLNTILIRQTRRNETFELPSRGRFREAA